MSTKAMTRKVINERVYDTETAEQITQYEPIEDRDNVDYICETLYKTADGNWFLHQNEAPQTAYREKTGDGYAGGEEIIPLTPEEVLQWCARRASIDAGTVTAHFDDELKAV